MSRQRTIRFEVTIITDLEPVLVERTMRALGSDLVHHLSAGGRTNAVQVIRLMRGRIFESPAPEPIPAIGDANRDEALPVNSG